ncbi:hypothetical protein [Actinophytocola sediminis]
MRTRFRYALVAGLVGLIVPAMVGQATAAPVAAAPISWRMIDLGAGDDSVARAINDHGHVIGTRGDGEAFLWRDGQLTDLGGFTPTDINNHDQVVGHRRDGENLHAVLWQAGTLTDLGTLPGDQSSSATAVNDRTEIVGWSGVDASGPGRAFHWRDGVLTQLGNAPGQANDINDRGQIVGDVNGVAVQWSHGTESSLTTTSSAAQAVNQQGTTAGMHWGSSGSASFVWQRGRFTVIPPPAEEFAFLQAYGINDDTQVVGTSSNGAFVWERGTTTLLPALTRASGAYDINEHGAIAGENPTTTEGLVPHAVIWTR